MRHLYFNEALGAGTFGTVYRADLLGERGFRRPVAVKILHQTGPEMEMFLSRIRDEARLLGLLHDDCILKVLGLARVQGRDAVIMEYINGVDLQSVIQARFYPPPRALASLGALLAGTLHTTHNAHHPSTGEPLSVIHRDVKPANVMLSDRGGLKLLDFGVAKAAFESRESRTGQMVLGTLNYLAPEYIGTGQVSPAVDIYALGLVLLAAATGQEFGQPRLKQSAFEERREEMIAAMPRPYAPLAPILRGLLDWDPARRPDGATAERALQHLEEELTGKGLRSWSATAVRHIKSHQQTTEDLLGLIGHSLDLDASQGENSASWLVSNVATPPAPAAPSPTPPSPTPSSPTPPSPTPSAPAATPSPTPAPDRGPPSPREAPRAPLPQRSAHPGAAQATQRSAHPGAAQATQRSAHPGAAQATQPTLAPRANPAPSLPQQVTPAPAATAPPQQPRPNQRGCKAVALALALGMGAGLLLLAAAVAAWFVLN